MSVTESRSNEGQARPLPKPRTRMVPAGTHFASAGKGASEKAAVSDGAGAARPSGKRFAAPPERDGGAPRPTGRRFAEPASDGPEVCASVGPANRGLASRVPDPAGGPAPDSAGASGAPAKTPEAQERAAALESLDAPMVPPPSERRPSPLPFERPSAPVAVAPRPVLQGNRVRVRTASQPERLRADGAKRRHRPVLAIVLIALGAVLLLVAGGIFIGTLLRYGQARDSYRELEAYTVESDLGDGVPSVDFDALASINPDVVGWIYIPGTPVNYPVVQTDDNTTYLTRLFDGTENATGAIFMDAGDTPPGMYDQQTSLYGHHTYDGSMFKTIDSTLDQEEFDRIDVAYYITRSATFVLTPLLTAQVDETYLQASQPNFVGEGESLAGYLEDLLAQAPARAADAESRIGSTERVMSLITCAGEIVPRTTRAVMVLTVDQMVAHGM